MSFYHETISMSRISPRALSTTVSSISSVKAITTSLYVHFSIAQSLPTIRDITFLTVNYLLQSCNAKTYFYLIAIRNYLGKRSN